MKKDPTRSPGNTDQNPGGRVIVISMDRIVEQALSLDLSKKEDRDKLNAYIDKVVGHELGHALGLPDLWDEDENMRLMFGKATLKSPGGLEMTPKELDTVSGEIDKDAVPLKDRVLQ